MLTAEIVDAVEVEVVEQTMQDSFLFQGPINSYVELLLDVTNPRAGEDRDGSCLE